MTVNRLAFQTPQKTWHKVKWTRRGRFGIDSVREAAAWCQVHAGVEKADWICSVSLCEFKFRDPDTALLFQLTWC